MYKIWCEKEKIAKVYPLTLSFLAFICTLRYLPYAFSTVCGIVHCLKYANIKATSNKIDITLHEKIKECLQYIKANELTTDCRQNGQTPITFGDLTLMFDTILSISI